MRTKREGIVLVSLFAVFFLSSIAWAVDCPIPDTEQTKCYNSTQEITCPQPGEPFYGQDAQYPCNPHSYTMLADGTMVQDNVTGLIWENKADAGSGTWQDAQDVFIATLNTQNFGGHNDWRLPTIKELAFLVDGGRYDPSINTDYFTNTVSSGYWSSTTNASFPDDAWSVYFYYGGVHYGLKSYGTYVRAVRSGQCGSFDNFIDNGDGTVTNTDTGLMWQQDTAPSTYNWQEALSYCETLTLADYTDWRLPNRNELQSIVDYSRENPSIDPIFNAVSSDYWSSTTSADFPGLAWSVHFSLGIVDYYGKSSGFYVRAVRSGQCGSFDTSTTTTISGSTTTTIGGGCPPESPIDCGNGGCCFTDYPVCCDDGYCYVNPEDCTGSETTTTISGSTTTTVEPCPTEEIYGEHSEETEILRYLRDDVLSQTPEGQELTRLYYELSPVIIEMMEENDGFREEVKQIIDGVLRLIMGEAE